MKRNTRVSTAVIRRLPRYYRQLSELQDAGVVRISSSALGKSMGLSPLASLAAIYVGLKLFGIIGVVLGPFGLIAIQELARFDEKD